MVSRTLKSARRLLHLHLRHWPAAFLFVLAGCSSTSGKVDPTAGWSAERLYSQARNDMSSGSWSDARTHLEALEAR